MRAVVQRVLDASVTVDTETVAKIGHGLLVLLGVTSTDTASDIDYICDKLINLRIFEDECGKQNLSIVDVSGEILIVSQFTLYGDARKGRRPSFSTAAVASVAEPMYNTAIARLAQYVPTKHGIFGADMKVALTNDGPVTILLDSTKLF